MKTSLLYGALHSLYNRYGNSIFFKFSFFIHSHDRKSSISRVHTTTWDYFTKHLADRFINSPEAVKEEIMTDINDLVKDLEFGSPSNRAVQVETSFFAMRSSRLLGILLCCFVCLERDVRMQVVCFDIISFFFATASTVDLADNKSADTGNR